MGLDVEQQQEQHISSQTTNTSQIQNPIPTENHANGNIAVNTTITTLSIVEPHSLLPKPAPPTASNHRNGVVRSSSFGKFLRQRSNDLSSAIARGISSLKLQSNDDDDGVTEFNLSGMKVVVTAKKNDASLAATARVSFFSRSNCRDCGAVRRFFREKGVKFVEINVDVYAERERELRERTGSATVPKIFFNGKLIGGLVELNLMRKGGELEERLRETAVDGGDGPAAPEYGFDEVTAEEMEEVAVVRVLRQRLPIQDRLMKMKIVRNCFAGSELVELLVRHHGCDSSKVRFVIFPHTVCIRICFCS